MSHQPLSRADRNRAVPRCFAGRAARFDTEERITVCVAVDPIAGTATYESMTLAEHARRFTPTLTVAPEDMRASFADPADAYHFRAGPGYERLPDGTWSLRWRPTP